MLVALAVLGCGSTKGVSSSTTSASAATSHAAARPPVCRPAALAAVQQLLQVSPGAVHTRVTTDNSNAPECFVSVPVRRLRMWVSVNGEPQPYAVLERAAEEEAQMFTATRTTPAPQHIDHLGLDAYWFPEESHVMTTDAVRLITSTIVSWPRVPKRRWKAVAAAVARPYLGRSNPKLARGPSPS
jgi:hypothetical protein